MIELLAPAGGWEQLFYALHFGADAVYLACDKFGLRSRAGNFSLEENGSVQSVADDSVSIAGGDGEIIVNGCDDVTVYTLGGSLVSDGQVNVNVPAGFYIVKAGGKVAKVAVK